MDNYQKYAVLQKEIDVLEAQKALLRAEIESHLPEAGHKDGYVTASWKSNKKWTYSPVVQTLEEKLKAEAVIVKEQKEVEEKTGVATFEETKSIVIKVK